MRANRCRTSSSPRVAISITLRADTAPDTSSSADGGTSRPRANTLMTAAFALPPSAAARTRTFKLFPSQPEISSLDEPGTTFKCMRMTTIQPCYQKATTSHTVNSSRPAAWTR